MKPNAKKRRSSETRLEKENVKELEQNKKIKMDQDSSPQKNKNINVTPADPTSNKCVLSNKLKKKNKKRKLEESEDAAQNSKLSKKLKKNKKTVEKDKESTKLLNEPNSKESPVKKNKKKSKKNKKMKGSTSDLTITSNKPTSIPQDVKLNESGSITENGVGEPVFKKSKKKKKKNKQLKKSEDSSMDCSASPSKLSLKKLNKKKKKLMKELEKCEETLKTKDESTEKKIKKKKKSKQLKQLSDSSFQEFQEKTKNPTSLGCADDFSIPTKTDLEQQIDQKSKKVKVISTKRKNKLTKNEFRKEIRQQEGQFFFLNQFSLEEMKEKIAEIQSRDEKSNRAMRILRTLKKKVEVVENSFNKKDSALDTGESRKKKEGQKLIERILSQQESDSSDLGSSEQTPAKKLFFEDRTGTAADDVDSTSSTRKNVKQLFFDDLPSSKENKSGTPSPKKNKNSPAKQKFFEDKTGNESESTPELLSPEKSKKLNKTPVKKLPAKDNSSNNIGDNEPSAVVWPKNLDTQVPNKPANPNERKQRYVLFVGNLAYDATTVDLKKHFLTKVSKVCSIRIPLDRQTNKPRGIAFVEVENSTDFEKALSLHGTFFNNRPIKVEYTTASKKNDKREAVHKNKKLSAMRKAGMLAGSKKDSHKRSFRRNFKNKPKK